MKNIAENPSLFIIAIVLAIILIFVTRAIFSIPTILKYYKANTLLLVKIARQHGVNQEEIDEALDVIEEREGKFTSNYNLRDIDKGSPREKELAKRNTKN